MPQVIVTPAMAEKSLVYDYYSKMAELTAESKAHKHDNPYFQHETLAIALGLQMGSYASFLCQCILALNAPVKVDYAIAGVHDDDDDDDDAPRLRGDREIRLLFQMEGNDVFTLPGLLDRYPTSRAMLKLAMKLVLSLCGDDDSKVREEEKLVYPIRPSLGYASLDANPDSGSFLDQNIHMIHWNDAMSESAGALSEKTLRRTRGERPDTTHEPTPTRANFMTVQKREVPVENPVKEYGWASTARNVFKDVAHGLQYDITDMPEETMFDIRDPKHLDQLLGYSGEAAIRTAISHKSPDYNGRAAFYPFWKPTKRGTLRKMHLQIALMNNELRFLQQQQQQQQQQHGGQVSQSTQAATAPPAQQVQQPQTQQPVQQQQQQLQLRPQPRPQAQPQHPSTSQAPAPTPTPTQPAQQQHPAIVHHLALYFQQRISTIATTRATGGGSGPSHAVVTQNLQAQLAGRLLAVFHHVLRQRCDSVSPSPSSSSVATVTTSSSQSNNANPEPQQQRPTPLPSLAPFLPDENAADDDGEILPAVRERLVGFFQDWITGHMLPRPVGSTEVGYPRHLGVMVERAHDRVAEMEGVIWVMAGGPGSGSGSGSAQGQGQSSATTPATMAAFRGGMGQHQQQQ